MYTTTIAIKILNIENNGIHLLIEAYINRKKTIMILDTGASKTVFDKESIQRLIGDEAITQNDVKSVGVGGHHLESHQTIIKSFRLGKLTIKNYTTVLIDLSHVNEIYKQLDTPAI